MTYADKYDARRYSTYRLYRDNRRKVNVDVEIGRLYPNVLDHVVLDDGGIDAELIIQLALSPLVDDAAASNQRFASRCLAADKSEMMVNALSQAIMTQWTFPKPIIDVLLFYGAKLDQQDSDYFRRACLRGMNDVVQQGIENGRNVTIDDMYAAIESGNCDTIKLVFSAYRGSYELTSFNLINATVQSLELCMSLSTILRGKHYSFSKIPSFSVLQWILDHDVMKHDRMLIDIAFHASRCSGHYFDMLRYLIEQRNFTVPRDILINLYAWHATDLGVFDYLLVHGADVNASNVLECSPLLIRYWIDKGLVFKPDDETVMILSIYHGMTAPVLEMMIDKYELNVNAGDDNGCTALHHACRRNRLEIVEMLLRHGADVNKRSHYGETPYDLTSDDRIEQLLIQNGYRTQHCS